MRKGSMKRGGGVVQMRGAKNLGGKVAPAGRIQMAVMKSSGKGGVVVKGRSGPRGK